MEKRNHISKWVVYSPLLFMIGILILVSLISLVYNQFDYADGKAFQEEQMTRLVHKGVAKELAQDYQYLQNQHLLLSTQQRLLFGLIVSLVVLILVGLFTQVVFAKIVKKALHFHDEWHTQKEKTYQISQELQEANRLLSDQLYIDSLTQLENRLALDRDLKEMGEPKVMLIDIDGFKDINEYYGSGVGDYILQEVNHELRRVAHLYGMKLYRSGADEFALVEDLALDLERYETLATELLFLFKGRLITIPSLKEPVEITIAIGVALDHEEPYEKASMALNEAKRKEIDYLCYFKKIERTTRYAEQIKWSAFIKQAIEKDSVVPYFQPIFDREGNRVKFECLVRLLDEHEEAIPPGLFLSISKRVKRYADIEKVLINKSFAMIAGSNDVISINLLARDMSDSNVSNFVVQKLKEYDVAKQVVFEILEDESIESLERVGVFIDRVKRMGCKIAIDDFGTGYSNFSYLLKLKPDYIKIDGSLIKTLERGSNSEAIVSAIITFAQKLGIKTIAEYVHNAEVHALCMELGIDEFQGYFLGEPMAKPRSW